MVDRPGGGNNEAAAAFIASKSSRTVSTFPSQGFVSLGGGTPPEQRGFTPLTHTSGLEPQARRFTPLRRTANYDAAQTPASQVKKETDHFPSGETRGGEAGVSPITAHAGDGKRDEPDKNAKERDLFVEDIIDDAGPEADAGDSRGGRGGPGDRLPTAREDHEEPRREPDGPDGFDSTEQSGASACFPIRDESVIDVAANYYRFGLQAFTKQERPHIDTDENLSEFLERAYGWYEQLGDGDRDSFFGGAAFVHHIVRHQGVLPLMHEDTTEALDREIGRYQDVADNGAFILREVLEHAHESPFARFPELRGTQFESLLGSIANEQPVPPAFVVGAEMMYAVLQNADLQGLGKEAALDLDNEWEKFFQ